jgi:hypothetical protein
MAVGLACAPAGASETVSEQAVRAVMVYNFLQFTEWTATTGSSQIRVCVSSQDAELMNAMRALRDRQVRGKSLITAKMANPADCDVIYVDARTRWQQIVEQQAPRHVLTIGGYPGFLADGGMIEIDLREGACASTSICLRRNAPSCVFIHNCCGWRAASWNRPPCIRCAPISARAPSASSCSGWSWRSVSLRWRFRWPAEHCSNGTNSRIIY